MPGVGLLLARTLGRRWIFICDEIEGTVRAADRTSGRLGVLPGGAVPYRHG